MLFLISPIPHIGCTHICTCWVFWQSHTVSTFTREGYQFDCVLFLLATHQIPLWFPGLWCPPHRSCATGEGHSVLHPEEIERKGGEGGSVHPLLHAVLPLVPGEDTQIHQQAGLHRGEQHVYRKIRENFTVIVVETNREI